MNFNWRSSHGHHGSKRRELTQHAHSRGSHAFTHTLINTVTTTLRETPAQLLRNLESIIILTVPEGGEENRSTRRKNPDSLPANRNHILEEKIQRPGGESNPHPPTLGISSLGQERAPRLTH